MNIRNYGKIKETVKIMDLVQMQTNAYEKFMQPDTPAEKRKDKGLEAIFRETFPITSYDSTMSFEYIRYEFGKPRYTPEECRKFKLTYGRPLRVLLRLNKPDEPIEEDVYMGEIPFMVGGAEFIINGTERVIVTQLHRSPGVDFLEDLTSELKLHTCRIIPERGSWIEIDVGKKDLLSVRIDQSGKLPATCFLRALSDEFSTNENIIKLFYDTASFDVSSLTDSSKLEGKFAAADIVDSETGEIIIDAGREITEDAIKRIVDINVKTIEIINKVDDMLILNTLDTDFSSSYEDALFKIYARFRPGNPRHLEKAKQLFFDKFFDVKRYKLGPVGRFRLNKKLGQDIPADVMSLDKWDFVNSIRYILKLRKNEGSIDDIDHLGNRRLRTIDELAGEEIRKGFLKLKRTVQERINTKDTEGLTPRGLVNSKIIFSAVDYFFSRGELSQVLDQTNPLAQLTHERRLSALGPGGLNRKRAGFEVRDVHISHYGRICPIETPEGTNIGLIASLSIYAKIDDFGFLITPYHRLENGKIKEGGISYLRADEEDDKNLAPADIKIDTGSYKPNDKVLVRNNGDFKEVNFEDVDFMEISPKQIVGISASLIPFLEHSDANRALMGSNMQRQAVPLLITEPPIIATGMERVVAENSSMVVCAKNSGIVTYVDASKIIIDNGEEHELRKFVGLNEGTCLNQKPIVKNNQKVKKGEIIADGAATCQGELSLGRNVRIAFMAWDGYNFEDAMVVSEKLVKDDRFTSIHRDEFELQLRETKLGREEFTRDIPNVPEKSLMNLDEFGMVHIGTKVKPGDVLIGKIAPKSRGELSPEEKLLHAIFGRAGEDVKNESLEVPSGVDGTVIDTREFSRRANLPEDKRKKILKEINDIEQGFNKKIAQEFVKIIRSVEMEIKEALIDGKTGQALAIEDGLREKEILAVEEQFDIENIELSSSRKKQKAIEIYRNLYGKIDEWRDEKERKVGNLKRGDELPSGVLEVGKVSVATKRKLSVGDKMAGRHGNKGVIAKILPEEDMPFLEDGTRIEILLNPLGVPSRMNVGQLLETHLGWASKELGFQSVTPIFEGATEEEIRATLREAGLPEDGKVTLYDGRTGEPFDQKICIGYMYMLKLNHLVDEKVHARATGPYSLITQQPLGGKARFGGQRFGEMEVWALEAYGAAYNLQELITVKSDDVEGRTRIYESMVKGENVLESGTPASFEVLISEIEGLCLNLKLEKS
ncbi:MAG: DNA-directed RNA polymerase subunit beta [Candidatus Anammoxibacter sp.]